MTTEPLDAITLKVWWSRLVAIADEAATTLLRTAFSTIYSGTCASAPPGPTATASPCSTNNPPGSPMRDHLRDTAESGSSPTAHPY